ncbi:hypothetical protein SAMN05421739_10625 [Pontibacter chinhatensis]|uniref:Lipocalin-like domain-containing protein n=1 Tax=Pontibacter chinhatensis TaxID=1436961 RepID=A0A1I2XFA6_9BACT|nr:hypothetical protein SAMN05421739_10625 [Pontibacter chinhatensis]
MRVKNILLYLFLFLSSSALVSCDDDDDAQPEPTKTEIITSGEWRGDKVLLNSIDVSLIPGVGENANTFQTLRLNVKADKTYKATFQANGQDQTYEGGWEFNNDETQITLENLGVLDIERLTMTNMDLSTTIDVDNLNLLGDIIGVDRRLIQAFTGGNPVNAELRFVK